jgi:hypothetical protein
MFAKDDFRKNCFGELSSHIVHSGRGLHLLDFDDSSAAELGWVEEILWPKVSKLLMTSAAVWWHRIINP